jgi:DNA-directed RNA polymerase subunit RPC12/RpoP
MDKYIKVKDLEALLIKIKDEPYTEQSFRAEEKDYRRGWLTLSHRLFKDIEKLPYIEVPPQGFYEWSLVQRDEDNYHKCSCCGAEYLILPPNTFEDVKKYITSCPNCGARITNY